MFEKHLEKYNNQGVFIFDFSKNYKEVCNAPDTLSGVYVIYSLIDGEEIIVYIGSSGQRSKTGMIKHRRGGMKDRLINGYHPNKFGRDKRIRRHIALPHQMTLEGISEMRIYWWVTYEQDHQDFPTDVEKLLLQDYILKYQTKPRWHK